MDDFIALRSLNAPEDDRVPVSGRNQGKMDADSLPALRRLYMQMGFVLHDHGIETLPQLQALLNSIAVKRTSGQASRAAIEEEKP